MIAQTKTDTIVCVWSAFVIAAFGVLTALLLNFKESYLFLLMALMLIRLGHIRYPEPRPNPPFRIVFPNNIFLRWTFCSLSLFLAVHGAWQIWKFLSKILFSG